MPNLLIKFNKFGITFCERFYCWRSAIAFFTPSAKSWF